MIEEKRGAMRGDPDKEAKVWMGKIAEADRQRARAQALAVEGLLSPDELRAKLSALEEAREAAEDALEALRGRKGKVEELERDRDALSERYTGMIPEGLDALAPEERRWTYKRIRFNVFADAEGSLSATWAFTRDPSVISQNARDDEGNAYLRLGEAYERLGRDDEARAAYERGVGQAEKFGHDGMADALRLALSELGEGKSV
jgi:tetratricopeptide (TPR) repeat protein